MLGALDARAEMGGWKMHDPFQCASPNPRSNPVPA
jgi:hypothetical protein